MSDWLTREAYELQNVVEDLARRAPLSLEGFMDKAGLSTQSLRNWRRGKRIPQPESLESVAHALILRGESLRTLGRELLALVEEEELRRRRNRNGDAPPESLPLFDPTGP